MWQKSYINLLKQQIGNDLSLHKFEVKIKDIEADYANKYYQKT